MTQAEIMRDAAPLETTRIAHVAMLAFALLFPTAATWVWFVLLAGEAGMQVVYGTAKTLQFALPVIWVFAVQRRAIRFAWPGGRGIALGLLFGAAAGAGLFALYFGFFKGHALLADAPNEIRSKLADFHAGTPARFLVLAVFYSVIHSFLEEYYWRWFAFGQLRRVVSVWPAIVISSLAFMSHHVIVVGMYLKPNWLAVGFFSLCVAAGGAFWAWLYARSGSLVGPWLSHMLVDVAIMALGYELVWGFAN